MKVTFVHFCIHLRFCPAAVVPVGVGKQGEEAGKPRCVPVVVDVPAAACGPRDHVWRKEALPRGWPVGRAFEEDHPLAPY